MKQKFKLLLAAPLLAGGVLYGGGYIAQFVRNYKVWEAAGGFAGDGTAPPFPSWAPGDCFSAIFCWPYGLIGLGICIALFGLLIVFVMKLSLSPGGLHEAERNITFSEEGVYGTSGYMNEKTMHELLEVGDVRKIRGTLLGQYEKEAVALPQNTLFNGHTTLCGSSGTMKSRAFIHNQLLGCIRRGESVIVTDPKSQLYEDFASYFKENGYLVRVLNLIHPEFSDGWNCMSEIQGDDTLADIMASTIISNTGGGKGDPFWDNGEHNLLLALILYIEHSAAGARKTMVEVMRLITMCDVDALDKLFSVLPVTHPAKAPYSLFQQASDTVKSGIVIGLGTRLHVLNNGAIQQMISHNEIDLELPGKQKCVYFILVSDQDNTFSFLSSLFFSCLFVKLIRYADQHGVNGRLPVTVQVIGEEWCNSIGYLQDLTKKISTIRSRGCYLTLCIQNLPQLENRYPDNQWLELIGNTDLFVFMGCSDGVTAKYISDRAGECSVCVESQSRMLGSWRISNYTPEFRKTASTGRRKLLTPDEVLRLPLDECLVILRGQKILKLKKLDYTKLPEYKKLKKSKSTDHIPAWKKRPQAAPKNNAIPKRPTVSVPKTAPPSAKLDDVVQVDLNDILTL